MNSEEILHRDVESFSQRQQERLLNKEYASMEDVPLHTIRIAGAEYPEVVEW